MWRLLDAVAGPGKGTLLGEGGSLCWLCSVLACPPDPNVKVLPSGRFGTVSPFMLDPAFLVHCCVRKCADIIRYLTSSLAPDRAEHLRSRHHGANVHLHVVALELQEYV